CADSVAVRAAGDADPPRPAPIDPPASAVAAVRQRLGAVAAVGLGGVVAVAALEQVAVVPWVPNHAVVAAFAEHLVVAIAAGQHVVAGAAEQQVVAAFAQEGVVAGATEQLICARAAGQHVVAGAAEQLGGGQRVVGLVERDRVVAALAEHLNRGGVGDRRRAARDGDVAAVDENLTGRVAADRDRVIEAVAKYRQQAGAWGKASFNGHGRRAFRRFGLSTGVREL